MICHMGKGLKTLQDVRGCAEGEHNITLVDKDVSTPDGLAVDWVHQLLFWTDTGLDQVSGRPNGCMYKEFKYIFFCQICKTS